MMVVESYILLEENGFRLQLIVKNGVSSLEFDDSESRFVIVDDDSLYIIDTLLKSLDMMLFKDSERFELRTEFPLGVSFNRYSFGLGHGCEDMSTLDMTEGFLVFGDQGCLFLYRYDQIYYFEICNIYEGNNNLDVQIDSLENWLKDEFFSIRIPVELELLNDLNSSLILIRERVIESLYKN